MTFGHDYGPFAEYISKTLSGIYYINTSALSPAVFDAAKKWHILLAEISRKGCGQKVGPFRSREEFAARLDAYLRYYCEGRIKRSLGWMSPDEYRRSKGYAV